MVHTIRKRDAHVWEPVMVSGPRGGTVGATATSSASEQASIKRDKETGIYQARNKKTKQITEKQKSGLNCIVCVSTTWVICASRVPSVTYESGQNLRKGDAVLSHQKAGPARVQ